MDSYSLIFIVFVIFLFLDDLIEAKCESLKEDTARKHLENEELKLKNEKLELENAKLREASQ